MKNQEKIMISTSELSKTLSLIENNNSEENLKVIYDALYFDIRNNPNNIFEELFIVVQKNHEEEGIFWIAVIPTDTKKASIAVFRFNPNYNIAFLVSLFSLEKRKGNASFLLSSIKKIFKSNFGIENIMARIQSMNKEVRTMDIVKFYKKNSFDCILLSLEDNLPTYFGMYPKSLSKTLPKTKLEKTFIPDKKNSLVNKELLCFIAFLFYNNKQSAIAVDYMKSNNII